jgi:hypothetical protein
VAEVFLNDSIARHLRGDLDASTAIHRGTFSSVNALVKQIRDYVEQWNTDAQPFMWTATADEILAKVRWVEANAKQLVDNNAK